MPEFQLSWRKHGIMSTYQRSAEFGNPWTDREYWAGRMTEDFFGNRAHQQFSDTSAAMGAGRKQVNLVFTDDLGEYFAHFPVTNIRNMRKAFDFQGELLHFLLSPAVRVFVD